MSKINEYNVKADKLAYGKWSDLNSDYFSNPEIAKQLIELLLTSNINLPKNLEIIEFGSADGFLGEYVKNSLSKDHDINLTITDVVKEHLDANHSSDTRKIHSDILTFNKNNAYNLALLRSVLHYFSETNQYNVIKTIYNSLKDQGYAVFQIFIQNVEDYDLFMKLNQKFTKKSLNLLPLPTTIQQLKEAGFTDVKTLEKFTTWNCSSENLQYRYNLNDREIQEIRDIIERTPPEKRTGFQLSTNRFTVPVPYYVIIAQK